MTDVKGRGKQAEKSRQTRRKILNAAEELFVERGYGTTSLQDVADRAGVAVQTIYFTFRNKRTVLKELVDVAVAGDDEPVATMDRPWFTTAMAAPTADEHLRAHIEGAAGVLERIAAINDVVRTAAAMDPEIRGLWTLSVEPRFIVQDTAAKALVAKPGARASVTREQAADALFAVLSPELFLLFVRDRGWTLEKWRDWAYATLRVQLIDDSAA